FMPGSNARALEKAKTLSADGIILDLEDLVSPDAKAPARDQVAAAVTGRGFGRREVIVRVNGRDTPWWLEDLGMAAKGKPDGVLVPKVQSTADLNAIADRFSDIGADHAIRVWIMIETPLGVLRVQELAGQGREAERRVPGGGGGAAAGGGG